MSGIEGERCGDRFAIALIVAAPHLRQRRRALHHHEIDLAGDEIGHGRTGAAIRDERNLRVRELLQQNSAHLRGGELIDKPGFAGTRFHPGNQLPQIVRRQGFPGDQKLRIDRDQSDRLEILLQIVVQIKDDAADMRVPLADVDGVAVGSRARDAADGDAAAGAADILDDERLTEQRLHLFGDDAGGHVGRTAGRERHDQRDLPRRIGLRPCRPDERRERDNSGCYMQEPTAGKRHGVLLASSLNAARGVRNKTAADGRSVEGGNWPRHVPQAALGSVYTINPSTQ